MRSSIGRIVLHGTVTRAARHKAKHDYSVK